MRLTALAGGTGAAKFLRGLTACLDPRDLTIVGNTGDDDEVWGLHVSPDLDSLTYALAGVLDRGRGWGRVDETFRALEAMSRLGEDTWFQLGDRDLATHVFRTRDLRRGMTLTTTTARIARALGVSASILPMSDMPVRTRIRTPDGWLTFQEYFVRDKARPAVLEVAYDGAAGAHPAPGVVAAILDADAVVVCPSNPVTSIAPILAVPDIAGALQRTAAWTIAISPIVGTAPVSGPAGALMRACHLDVSAVGVAAAYRPWLRAMVLDARDGDRAEAVRAFGITPIVTDTLMTTSARETALARAVLAALP